MKRKYMLLQAFLLSAALGSSAAAAVSESDVTKAYDSAVDLQY